MAPLNPETDVSMFKFDSFCKYFISKVFGEILFWNLQICQKHQHIRSNCLDTHTRTQTHTGAVSSVVTDVQD